jgi:hypothetical protein
MNEVHSRQIQAAVRSLPSRVMTIPALALKTLENTAGRSTTAPKALPLRSLSFLAFILWRRMVNHMLFSSTRQATDGRIGLIRAAEKRILLQFVVVCSHERQTPHGLFSHPEIPATLFSESFS